MTDCPVRALDSVFATGSSDIAVEKAGEAAGVEPKSTLHKTLKPSFLSSLFASTLSIFESHNEIDTKATKNNNQGWASAVKKVAYSSSMRRLHERFLGVSRADTLSSTSEIWLLGKCYNPSPAESSSNADPESSYAAFLEDFSSRIWITYRKGFDAIGDSKYTSDVKWGCMIRSSQMLVAQALMFHHLGRSWRKPLQKPYDPKYIEILHLFGDYETCAFSIHNLLQAGRAYGLAVGSWLGPYAMCRTWETLARSIGERAINDNSKESLPMATYVVSGDEEGERGGAPVLCIDVVAKLCSDLSKDQVTWAPILLLVPLVLGLEKVNTRYIPLLCETFTFPQSLGILGGKPGASTYIVGIQDDKALYLDPHEVQLAVDIKRGDLEADTSSYHCSTIRHLPLDTIDSSLAIGFYCRDKEHFEDFCSRAILLVDKSNGAPLFTVVQSLQPAKSIPQHNGFVDAMGGGTGDNVMDKIFVENFTKNDADGGEDEWQIL